MVISARALESALKEKGFRLDRKTNDKVYYFYYGEKKTQIHTKISFGKSEDLRDRLIGIIKRQMFFDSAQQLTDFIHCRLTLEAYVEHLKEKQQL